VNDDAAIAGAYEPGPQRGAGQALDCHALVPGCEPATYPDTLLIVSSLTTNPNDENEVWITLAGWENGEKVYRSDDAGLTWENRTGTLPNIPVNAIIAQDTDGSPAEAVYIGTDIGVFYYDASLGDWIPYSNDLPLVEVTDLEINYSDNKLLAGTFGRGIWISDLFSACTSDIVITTLLQSEDHSYFFQASDSITSDLQIDGFGVSITYQAENVVHLQEGFHASAKKGALFYATNKPCSGGVPNPLMDIPGTPEPDSNTNPEGAPSIEEYRALLRKHTARN
jgi:hypothetical protein